MTGVDLSKTIQPRSDQVNADDLISGPRTVTIVDVRAGSAEQPVNIVTQEFGPSRPYKPGLSMRRVLVEAWGEQGADYVGRRLTLYRDPNIRFGKDTTGGIRISHMSHITAPILFALTVTRGKRAPFKVEPLPDVVSPVDEHVAAINATSSMDQLVDAWKAAQVAGVSNNPAVIAAKDAKKQQHETTEGSDS